MRAFIPAMVMAIAITAAPPTRAQEDEALTVDIKRMTLQTALSMAQSAVDKCAELGIQIGVTVVDRDGVVQVTLRDTIAAPLTARISRAKAYTAVNFNTPTAELAGRADTPVGRVDGLIMSAGGLPLEVGGSLIGGIGVSGAPSGETDDVCAQAGIDAVRDEIEMAL